MNKYEKLGEIGEGTFGVVLKCRHKETDEIVAIKKFKEQSEEDEISRKVTLREVKLLRALKHENIVDLKEAFRRKGVLYLVFEYIDQSVMDLLEAKPRGVGTEIVQVLTFQLLRALEHCHRHNVIHRDIKPENLLVSSSDNSLRLCDFGCARQIKADVALTDYVATRWYRPPELLLSTADYGKAVDMWGLGCIMGELTDGQPLFAGKSDIDQLCVIQRILGPLTSQQMERCLELSDFKGIQFPDVSQPVTLQKRYEAKMPPLHMELLIALIIMDPSQRLTAKAALRSACFKDLRAKDSAKPAGQPSAAGHDRKAKNVSPEFSGPAADPGSLTKAAKVADCDSATDMPPVKQTLHKVASRAEMPTLTQAPRAGAALPSISGSGAVEARVEENVVLPRQSKQPKGLPKEQSNQGWSKFPKDAFGTKKDFHATQDGFGAKREKKEFGATQEGFGAKRDKKDMRVTQEGFGAKREKKDFRVSQDSFAPKQDKKEFRASQGRFSLKQEKKDFRMTQESFGAKRELPAPLEETSAPCEDSFEEFLRSTPSDQKTPGPNPWQDTPQSGDMYRLPWENAAPSDDPGIAEPSRSPTPIFGSGSHRGFLADAKSTGGGLPGAGAKNGKAPLASVARWQGLGVRESRWSGA